MTMNQEEQQAYSKGYHVGFQHGREGGGEPPEGAYPIDIVARYPPSSSRLLMLLMIFKPFLLIPHLIALWAFSIAAFFVMVIAWFAVLFTGKYPEGLWRFMVGLTRWQTRVGAYLIGLTDVYPPFSI